MLTRAGVDGRGGRREGLLRDLSVVGTPMSTRWVTDGMAPRPGASRCARDASTRELQRLPAAASL